MRGVIILLFLLTVYIVVVPVFGVLSDRFVDVVVLEPREYSVIGYVIYYNALIDYSRDYNLTGSEIILVFNLSYYARSDIDTNWRSITINVSLIIHGEPVVEEYNGTMKNYTDHTTIYVYYKNNTSSGAPNPLTGNKTLQVRAVLGDQSRVEKITVKIYALARAAEGAAEITNATYKLTIIDPRYTNTSIIPIPHWSIDPKAFTTGFLGGVLGALITLILLESSSRKRRVR